MKDPESCLETVRPSAGTQWFRPEAKRAVEAACAAGAGEGCLWLANALGEDPVEAPEAERLLRKGCAAGWPDACIQLGQRLARRQVPDAESYIVKGCAVTPESEVCGSHR